MKSETVHKVFYLADRNMLVDQSIEQDFAPLQKTIHKVNVKKDQKNTVTSYEVYFSLYQQLVGDDDQEHFSELFAPDFFDLIIVDECHRGSAKEESRWRRVLEYFSDAVQIGMTATPKETKYISNLSYFGEACLYLQPERRHRGRFSCAVQGHQRHDQHWGGLAPQKGAAGHLRQ